MSQTFVVEIGCEELPPKSLYTLHLAFADALKAQLIELALPFEAVTPLAAPRRPSNSGQRSRGDDS